MLFKAIDKDIRTIKGDLFLMEGNRLEFIPRRKFDNGTSYEAVLNLGEFIALPKNMQKFRMKWETLPLGMKFEGGELRIQQRDRKSVV